eukprot:s256_g6.t1
MVDGMVSSEEYVRTSRQVVFKIQKAVNRALVEGSSEQFHEDENIEKLAQFAADAGANPNRIKKRHTVLTLGWGRFQSAEHTQLLRFCQIILTLRRTRTLRMCWLTNLRAGSEGIVGETRATKYFVTISRRTALRRLHLSWCFVRPDRCCEVVHMDEMNQDDFDTICQACRKNKLQESDKEPGDVSFSTRPPRPQGRMSANLMSQLVDDCVNISGYANDCTTLFGNARCLQ